MPYTEPGTGLKDSTAGTALENITASKRLQSPFRGSSVTSTDFNCNVNAPQAVIASFILRCLCFLKKIKRNIHEFYETDPTEASSRLEDRRLVEQCN